MDRLLLIDAYAFIYRSYYAFISRPLINSKGENVSAVVGFVNSLEESLRVLRPSHVGVAFDTGEPTFRHRMFPAYKAQREVMPEAIRFAVPVIKEIVRAYGIPILEAPGFEADDVIGTLSKKADGMGINSLLMTPDKDYGQLVTENIRMYRPKHGDREFEVLGPAEITARYGIERPQQVIDILGLMGDASDNIPGCPGIGEKTAARLVRQFGGIDGLLEHTAELKGVLREKVEANVEQIRLSKVLATIKTDVPVEFSLESLEAKEADEEILRPILERVELRALIAKKFTKRTQRTQRITEPTLFDSQKLPEFADKDTGDTKNTQFKHYEKGLCDYQLIETKDDRRRIINLFLTQSRISLDTETTSVNALAAKLVGLSFSVKENQAFYVPIPSNQEEAQEIVDEFKAVYENERILKIGQNLKYDLMVLENYGVHLKGAMFDTMIAHYLLHPDRPHNMDYMAEALLGYRTIHIDELIGPKGKKQKNMSELSPDKVYEYACEDADVTLKLKNILEPMLQEQGCAPLFQRMEMPLMPVLARMERNGVQIDTNALEETSTLFTERMRNIETEIEMMAGRAFNITSPKQVGEVLFDDLKISSNPKKTKTGQYVTSEEVLRTLRGRHPIVEKILDYRGLKKLLGTYIDALPRLVNPRTGRIHTSFNQTVTLTGRLSSSGPNLQNIPVRNEEGKEVRKAFVAEPGCLLLSADYSQIELRIMAHLSGDEHMIEAFKEGQDIHAATAAKIFKKTIDLVTRDERTKAKTANFGIIYGITPFGLAERMNVSRAEATQLINDYFQTFPKVKEYINKSIQTAHECGFTQTIFGRRCPLPDINSRNATVRGYAERIAVNAPIQGSAADIVKIAMIETDRRLTAERLRTKMLLQVHDELIFNVPANEKDAVERIVADTMEHAYEMQVPLVVDCGWGLNWLEAH